MIAFLLSTQVGRLITGAIGIVALIGLAYVWLLSHDARVAAEARQGYVILAEKTAAEAKANELQRQINAATGAQQSLQQQIQKDAVDDAAREKDRDARILEMEARLSQANRRCSLSRDDITDIVRDR
jgi:hypothetical protein